MKPTEHMTKTPRSATTGILAMLRGLLGVKGSGASRVGPGSGALAVPLCAVVGLLVFSAAPALAAAPEAPETLPATSIAATTATLKGILNPGVKATAGYYFAYSPEISCLIPGFATSHEAEAEVRAEKVEANVTELQPNKEYHFCLVATNEGGLGETPGNEVTFSTHAAAPVIGEESVKNVTETTATIAAKVNPEGLDTHVYVEYGEGRDTAPVDIGAVVGEREVSFALKGLTVGTSYPFHVVAFNDDGKVEGESKTFSTLAPPPAHGERPWWRLSSGARPTYLPPYCTKVTGTGKYENSRCTKLAPVVEGKSTGAFEKGTGQIAIVASNVGDAGADGETSPVLIRDVLPKGVTAAEAEGVSGRFGAGGPVNGGFGEVKCELQSKATVVECAFAGTVAEEGKPVAKILPPYYSIEVNIVVHVESHAVSGALNQVSVQGGGALEPVSIARPVTISGQKTPFGLEGYEVTPEEPNGVPDTQAGSHPFQTTFTVNLNSGPAFLANPVTRNPEAEPAAIIKDFNSKLPPGLVGNPTAFPRCTLPDFQARICPPETIVGAASVTVNEPRLAGLATFVSPVFNLEPSVGEPARFGFLPTTSTPAFVDTSLRTGADYGIDGESNNITQVAGFFHALVTFWGVPGDARHNSARGGCLKKGFGPCTALEEHNPPPFLVLPTSCSGQPLVSEAEADSWLEPRPAGQRLTLSTSTSSPMPTLTGCNQLRFEPQIRVTPDSTAGSTGTAASTPTGLTVDVHVPQESILNGKSLADSTVKDITVALPEGVAINPSDASGLEACPEGLIGFEGDREFPTDPGVSNPVFTPRIPGGVEAKQHGEEELEPGVNFCSNAAKIGTVKIKTPLLPNPLEGAVYLASQEANPFGSLMAMYVVAEDPVSGSLVKLPGEVTLTPSGQVIGTFRNNPQLPFEDAELHFFGGERAPLATPARCGSYTTNASFVPWSAEPWDEAALTVHSSSTFNIDTGPNGGPCPGAHLPFNPSVTGGATNLQAGAFTPLTVSMSRQSGEQNLKSIVAKLPPGLSGVLSGVELCPEPQANEGACGPNSLIGEATVSVGVGGQPFTVTGGKFYLTGPYNGTGTCSTPGTNGCAPFGLTFEDPAKAGPFDLEKTQHNHPACDCVIVRGKIELNPITSAITITSDPPGSPYSIPTMLEGIPLEIQKVNATTTRGDFQFNPTNCAKMSLEGIVELSEGGTHTFTEPFQVTNCAALKFEPKFSVFTSGKTSKANGASLTTKVTEPSVPQGTDSDIGYVKVELPVQLPSRLTTLQKACTHKQFEINPAGCPSASKIGMATVHTPLIPVPLQGPAIFVSNGGEAFPQLIMVLQGYGITIDLVGDTFISKSGITSTTFHTIPDQPFSTFELTLPEGPYSALAANGSLCKPVGAKTVKKRVKVRRDGHTRYVTRTSKERVASPLVMPNEFVGQNGAVIKQDTTIAVTNCAKAKPAKKAKKKQKKGKKSGGKGGK